MDMADGCDLASMVPIEGATFIMGSDRHYPEEAPATPVRVDGFLIDPTPVTNRQFTRFVAETGYVTFAEQAPDPAHYPGALPEMLQPGSLLFTMPAGPVSLDGWENWWGFSFGADWRHPRGPESDLAGLEQGASHGSRMGTGRARRAGWQGLCLG
jgi:formylglycine-generating enzyme